MPSERDPPALRDLWAKIEAYADAREALALFLCQEPLDRAGGAQDAVAAARADLRRLLGLADEDAELADLIAEVGPSGRDNFDRHAELRELRERKRRRTRGAERP